MSLPNADVDALLKKSEAQLQGQQFLILIEARLSNLSYAKV